MSFEKIDIHKRCFKISKCLKHKHYKDLIVVNIKRFEERKNIKKELKNKTIIKIHAVIYTIHGATRPKSIHTRY